MKVYQYYLNYRASRDNNPEWMGVAHTQDIQVRTAISETLSVHLQQYTPSAQRMEPYNPHGIFFSVGVWPSV